MPAICVSESVASMAIGTPAFSASAHSQSIVPSASQVRGRIVQEPVAQAEHAGLVPPAGDLVARGQADPAAATP